MKRTVGMTPLCRSRSITIQSVSPWPVLCWTTPCSHSPRRCSLNLKGRFHDVPMVQVFFSGVETIQVFQSWPCRKPSSSMISASCSVGSTIFSQEPYRLATVICPARGHGHTDRTGWRQSLSF